MIVHLSLNLCSVTPVGSRLLLCLPFNVSERLEGLPFTLRVFRIDNRFGQLVGPSASVAGQAMNRYRGTQAEFQFSMVSPHTAHSKLLISRASAMCSLRS